MLSLCFAENNVMNQMVLLLFSLVTERELTLTQSGNTERQQRVPSEVDSKNLREFVKSGVKFSTKEKESQMAQHRRWDELAVRNAEKTCR